MKLLNEYCKTDMEDIEICREIVRDHGEMGFIYRYRQLHKEEPSTQLLKKIHEGYWLTWTWRILLVGFLILLIVLSCY